MPFSMTGGHGNAFLQILSVSITPAILILAAGSLVSSTLTRLARIVDRARMLIDRLDLARSAGRMAEVASLGVKLAQYARRADLTERALTLYYISIGLFVAGSLAITIDNLTRDAVPWLSLVLVVGGAITLFFGTAALVVETGAATGLLRGEIEQACRSAPEKPQTSDI